VRIKHHISSRTSENELGANGSTWKAHEVDDSTTGTSRILPLYLGGVCTGAEENHKRAETNTFLTYASPALDGSIFVWHASDGYLQVCHIHSEDDENHEYPNGQVFGRGVESRVLSIEMSTTVSCLFQAYSAIWVFQDDGDVFAFQDSAPFARLGVTRKLTQDSIVQVISHMEVNFLVATNTGGVYYACLSDNAGNQTFQLSIISECIAPNQISLSLINIPLRSEVWSWQPGMVSVIKDSQKIDEFQCREVGHVPISASVCVGSGVWVSRGDLPTLYLYHIHSRRLIQTYDLSHSAFAVQPSHTFGVSSLTTMSNLLIAGTTSGIVIALPLPKLPVSKPSVVGAASASLYGPTERVQALHSVIPKYFNSFDSGLDRATGSVGNQIHQAAALLFAIGCGERRSNTLFQELKELTHISIWRSAS
jgi:hypothetical protein